MRRSFDGIVAKRMAEIGYHTSPGEQLLLITQMNDLWVTANFRETQLRRLHPREKAHIHVDALHKSFDGYVESMPAANGAVTSGLAPSEQAILTDTFPSSQRGMAFAIYGIAIVLAPAIGPTLGGFITDHLGWRRLRSNTHPKAN